MGEDYYKILKIPRNATDEDIKKAYREQALQRHPDKNKAPNAEKQFKRVTKAYEVLSDKETKQKYDKSSESVLANTGGDSGGGDGHAGQKFSYTFHGDSESTFAQFFGTSDPFGNVFYIPRIPRIPRIPIPRVPPMPLKPPIPLVPPMPRKPSVGTRTQGFTVHSRRNPSGDNQQDIPIKHDLYVSLEDIDKGCTKKFRISKYIIGSDGVPRDKEAVGVMAIPVNPGCQAGKKIKISFESHLTTGKLPEDIVFIIRDEPHAIFKRENCDIRYTAKISHREALNGTVSQIPTLLGSKIQLNIPPRVIQPATVDRIPGKGLPLPNDPSKRGDLLVSFDMEFSNTPQRN